MVKSVEYFFLIHRTFRKLSAYREKINTSGVLKEKQNAEGYRLLSFLLSAGIHQDEMKNFGNTSSSKSVVECFKTHMEQLSPTVSCK